MKTIVIIMISSLPFFLFCQNENYLESNGIYKETINELSFKNKDISSEFIRIFENQQGFELPKFLIIDDTGQLLKHKLDVLISECGKGDVAELKKRYYKKLPTIDVLDNYFNEKLETPKATNFVVVFIWHQALDKYNKHTFETYQTWKENDNIEFYFLNLEFQ